MNVAVITFDGSRYGVRVLNALARTGEHARLVVVVEDSLVRKVRLLTRVARHIGWRDASLLAVERQLSVHRARREREWRGAPLIEDYGALADDVVHVASLREPSTAVALRDARVDLLLLAQSGIVPGSLLDIPTIGTLNAHPGWLPEYRGLDCPLWACAHGDFERIGSSLHFVDAGIDTGPVALRRAYAWRGDETALGLEDRLYEDCVDLLVEGVRLAGDAHLQQAAQEEGNYYGILPRRLRRAAAANVEAFLRGRPL